MKKLIYTCHNCGDEYESEKKVKHPGERYCPYCEAVVKGEPDSSWLPSVDKEDLDKFRKGFHKV